VRRAVLLLLVACLSAVVIGAVVEGLFWLTLVALTLSLGLGALVVAPTHSRGRSTS
jgi:hypothetical protein